MSSGSLLGRVRNPEHTGENRCRPCTVVNVAIAALLAAAAALVAVELAAVVAVVSVAAIALRGYLVPGTPELTKRYLPERVLRAFGKAEAGVADPDDFEAARRAREYHENSVNEWLFLADEGVITGRDEDAELTPAFASELDGHVPPADADLREPLARLFDTDPDDVEIDREDYPSVTVGIRIREWPSWSALRVDVAANRALSEWTDRWSELPLEQRVELAERVRSLRSTCPVCGGHVEQSSEVQTSCCGVHEVQAVACTACGERLAELDPERLAGRIRN
ncbi:hypothetical protein [Haloarcula litorea]|uniref:hypothetical protein n=1 Tax=Haloarcula litorea TaxID=3032579 RepID=UPI0023E83CFD|nr:hypothetical protein [Halomicroarcula sp. GDY20]